MSAPTTQGQARSILQRILRLKEEQDALAEDIREVYLEAKSNGFDKTALGQAVSAIRKREKDPAKYEEQGSIAALYLNAFYGAGMDDATHTHEAAHADERTAPEANTDQADAAPRGVVANRAPEHAAEKDSGPIHESESRPTTNVPAKPEDAAAAQASGAVGSRPPSDQSVTLDASLMFPPLPGEDPTADDLEIPPFLRRVA